jgi:predicted metal-dependent phosphoesterase TrpH
LIDLHTHTTESDGSFTPAQLIDAAARAGIASLSITDHDTFAGYDASLDNAKNAGIELICGIEISTKLHGHSAHLLGYFPRANGLASFRAWIRGMQESRRERNVRLAERLRELGFDVPLAEAEALGRGMTGRPHFAQVMLRRGYVSNLREAFDKYLDESAPGYVYRREPQFDEAVRVIREQGGIASLAHPGRLKADVPATMPELCAAGLNAIEAYHSDHSPEETELYLNLAARYGLKVTGGSDFHGAMKPEVELGTGCDGNLRIPASVLESLRV